MYFNIKNDTMEEFENIMKNISYGDMPYPDEVPSPEEIYEAIWERHNNKEQLKMDYASEMDEEFANNNFNNMN